MLSFTIRNKTTAIQYTLLDCANVRTFIYVVKWPGINKESHCILSNALCTIAHALIYRRPLF